MQLRIYRALNFIALLVMLLTITAVVVIVVNQAAFAGNTFWVVVIFVAVSVILFFLYKMLENNWDKVLLQKKAFKGQIVLANIKKATYVTAIRDTSFKTYVLWAIDVTYYDHQLQPHDTTIIEKLNPACKTIPCGSVYMTYDEKHPDRGLIVQNVIISHIPSLAPLVANYEKAKQIKIKYLDTHYDNGLVIDTFKQQMEKEREAQKAAAQPVKPEAEQIEEKPTTKKAKGTKKK